MGNKTDAVREFYHTFPYPSYGAQLKKRGLAFYDRYCQQPGRYLEAGCGTGHVLVGTAVSLPHLQFWAIDISERSLAIARRVAEDHGVKIDFRVHDLMRPLPYDFKFRYINCVGVVHHLESAETGLRNLANQLEDGGYLFLHVYGEDYHRRRFQIKEMLDIVQDSPGNYEERFDLFKAYVEHHKRLTRGGILKRLYRSSPRDVVLPVIQWWQRRGTDSLEGCVHTWHDELDRPTFSERWLDQFANPNERSLDLREFCELLDAADLEPVEMFSLGRYRPEHLPASWQPKFEKLSTVDRYRLMELLNPAPTSPFCVARKKRA